MSSRRLGARAGLQAVHGAELRDEAVDAAGDERPGRRFVGARQVADDGHADRAAAAREAQLRERDVELGAPALGVARDLHVPHRVPAVVVGAVVEVVAVGLDAGGVDAELVGGAAVVVRVDGDLEPVGRRALVAAGEHAGDAAGLAVEGPDGDVERQVVVGDARLGAFGGRGRPRPARAARTRR